MLKNNQTSICSVSIDRLKGLFCLTAATILGAAGIGEAAIFNYAPPTIVGTNVTYPSVSETSTTNTTPLYNAPTISGNSLIFNNLNFAAVSTNASPALSFVDGQLNFTLAANSNASISSLTWTEFGDYNVSATQSNAAAVDFAKVFSQALQITILEINHVALATPIVDNTSAVMTLSPSNGDYQTLVDPNTGSWAGLATADLSKYGGPVTKISVSYDNELLGESQVGGIGTISKDGVIISPTLSVVPEPASLGLTALFVIGGLTGRRRRAAVLI